MATHKVRKEGERYRRDKVEEEVDFENSKDIIPH